MFDFFFCIDYNLVKMKITKAISGSSSSSQQGLSKVVYNPTINDKIQLQIMKQKKGEKKMQKVSKQSLAMLALSILLAISIALTFTFAAASASKTATGTIKFTGDIALEFSAATDNFAFNINVASTGVATTAADEMIKVASTSAPAYVTVQLSIEGNNVQIGDAATTKAVAVNLEQLTNFGAVEANKSTTTGKMAAGTEWKVADFISLDSDVTKYIDETADSSKVILTFTASATNA